MVAGEGNDDTNGQGRGSVTLAWPASPGADGYNIKLWDGYQYDQVATTTSTSWTSAGKGLYPTDTQIAAIPSGSTANPFKAGSGLDLRDNPDALYQRWVALPTPGSPRPTSSSSCPTTP